jgi:oligoendopeptidase F
MVLSKQPGMPQKYIEFLSAGGSDYPLNILKKAGVDMTTTAPTDAAFKNFDELVNEMQTIVDKLKKAGKL